MKPNKQRWCLWKKIVGSKGSRLKNKSGWGGQEKEAFLSFFKRRLLLSFFLSFFLPSFSSFSFQICFFWSLFVFVDPYLFFLIPICFFWSLTHSFLPSSHLPSTRKREKNPQKKREKNPKNSPPKKKHTTASWADPYPKTPPKVSQKVVLRRIVIPEKMPKRVSRMVFACTLW